MRCFIAAQLPPEARIEMGRLADILRRADADIKWVRPENSHFTFKFLGEVSEKIVPRIAESLDVEVRTAVPFEMAFVSLGVFPGWRSPRVIWAGLDGAVDKARDLVLRIEKAVKEYGFDTEAREFKPHLTLGRVKSGKNTEKLRDVTVEVKINPVSIKISNITVFKSDLTPTGPVYTPLHISNLAG